MKELKFNVETIAPTLKLGEDTVTRYTMTQEVTDGKIRIEFTFNKGQVPTEWLKILGERPGNEIIVSIGLKTRQSKLTE